MSLPVQLFSSCERSRCWSSYRETEPRGLGSAPRLSTHNVGHTLLCLSMSSELLMPYQVSFYPLDSNANNYSNTCPWGAWTRLVLAPVTTVYNFACLVYDWTN